MKSVCFMKHSNTKSLCYEQYLENDNNYDVCMRIEIICLHIGSSLSIRYYNVQTKIQIFFHTN